MEDKPEGQEKTTPPAAPEETSGGSREINDPDVLNDQFPPVSGFPELHIMARPVELAYDSREIDRLLSLPHVRGIGISGMADWEMAHLVRISDHCRNSGKMFALHFSEAKRESVEDLLSRAFEEAG